MSTYVETPPRPARWPDRQPTLAARRGRLAVAGARWSPDGLPAWVAPLTLSIAGIVLWAAMLASVDARAFTDIGLFGALPVLLLVGVGCLSVAFVWSLWCDAPDAVLAAQVVALVIVLFGTATFVEPTPRFETAWLHVGFTEYIARTGHTLAHYDARFSWPGFFSLAALATKLGGLSSARSFLGWSPVFFNLLYLAPLHVIARTAVGNRSAQWLAMWIFCVANWVGQDYFSPQAMAYFLFLVFVAVLLVWFRPRLVGGVRAVPAPAHEISRAAALWTKTRRALARLEHRAASSESLPRRSSRAQAGGLIAVMLLLFVAIVSSHQLTPFFLISGVIALTIFRRSSLPGLPVLLLVLAVTWISYFAVDFWSGHLSDLFGSVGHVGGNVGSNVTARVKGSSGHLLAIYSRIGLAGLAWALAGVGWLRRLRAGHFDLLFALLTAAAFPMLLAQSYGGEVMLRVYLFSLPFACVLCAFAFAPVAKMSKVAAVVAAVALTGASLSFLVARYGNERFESMTPLEAQGVSWLYAHSAPYTTFLVVAPVVPWRSQGLDQHRYNYDLRADPASVMQPAELTAFVRSVGRSGVYFILSRAEEAYGEMQLALPPGWEQTVQSELLDTGQYRLVYVNPDVSIVAGVAAPGDPAPSARDLGNSGASGLADS